MLKRVRFAESRDDNNAEMPEPTSAPSNFPAEAASSSSATTPSTETALPAAAIGVADQVMSEGASSTPDAEVRLSLKHSSDTSHSESETKRHHTAHSTRDVVMLLDDSDVVESVVKSVVGVTRFLSMCMIGTAFHDKLRACGSDGTTVACSSSGTTRELMSKESCFVDLLAAARNGNGSLQRKNIGKCVRQHKRGNLGAVGHCEEFDPVLVQRVKMEEKDFIDKMGVYDVVPRSAAAEKSAVSFASDGLQSFWGSDVTQEFRGRCGDKHEYFSETPDLALVKAVIARAARRAESEDIVIAVFDVWRAYFYAEEKRDTFVELLDYEPAEFQTTHVGKLRTEPAQLQRRGEMS